MTLIWHYFQDISTFTRNVTACDFEKSFILEKMVKIANHVCFIIHV